MSPAEWFRLAPKAFAAEVAELRQKAADRLVLEHEEAMARARAAELELSELGFVLDDSDDEPTEPGTEKPDSAWSIWRLVKHYLRLHPASLSTDITQFVLSIRPGDGPPRVMEKNVLAVLYKHSRPGRSLEQTGERGSFRYTLREEAET